LHRIAYREENVMGNELDVRCYGCFWYNAPCSGSRPVDDHALACFDPDEERIGEEKAAAMR
jgi:hypothetical protein